LSEAFLDRVDDRELLRPFIGLGEESLRLVEQAGVLERDARARGDGRDQALIVLRVRMLAIDAQADDPDHLIAGGDGHAEPRRGRCRATAEDRAMSRLLVEGSKAKGSPSLDDS